MNIGFARGFISIAHRGRRGDKAGQLQSQGRAGQVLTLVLAGGNPDDLTEELCFKDGLKVDGAAQAVIEAQPQLVRRDMLERDDAVNRMVHSGRRNSGLNWSGGTRVCTWEALHRD